MSAVAPLSGDKQTFSEPVENDARDPERTERMIDLCNEL
jgi:hypothetical protein